ncbi:MAG TPA: DUF447 domain-containing protein [Candidatus Polarisedimenticolia bacterium]
MILETIVSTLDPQGRPNFAPMGVRIEGERVLLRPFREARTWKNLEEGTEGVVNITDNVLLFARCAVASFVPPHHPAAKVSGAVLDDVCSWKEFRVVERDLTQERGRFWARIVTEGRSREFLGFNRARHAVLEATIAVTRIHLLGRAPVLEEVARLRPLVDKTGGPEEREAFAFLEEWIAGNAHAG